MSLPELLEVAEQGLKNWSPRLGELPQHSSVFTRGVVASSMILRVLEKNGKEKPDTHPVTLEDITKALGLRVLNQYLSTTTKFLENFPVKLGRNFSTELFSQRPLSEQVRLIEGLHIVTRDLDRIEKLNGKPIKEVLDPENVQGFESIKSFIENIRNIFFTNFANFVNKEDASVYKEPLPRFLELVYQAFILDTPRDFSTYATHALRLASYLHENPKITAAQKEDIGKAFFLQAEKARKLHRIAESTLPLEGLNLAELFVKKTLLPEESRTASEQLINRVREEYKNPSSPSFIGAKALIERAYQLNPYSPKTIQLMYLLLVHKIDVQATIDKSSPEYMELLVEFRNLNALMLDITPAKDAQRKELLNQIATLNQNIFWLEKTESLKPVYELLHNGKPEEALKLSESLYKMAPGEYPECLARVSAIESFLHAVLYENGTQFTNKYSFGDLRQLLSELEEMVHMAQAIYIKNGALQDQDHQNIVKNHEQRIANLITYANRINQKEELQRLHQETDS